MSRKAKRDVDVGAEPWLVFKPCYATCDRDCPDHGWFWGPGHEKEAWRGKRASWPRASGYSGVAT